MHLTSSCVGAGDCHKIKQHSVSSQKDRGSWSWADHGRLERSCRVKRAASSDRRDVERLRGFQWARQLRGPWGQPRPQERRAVHPLPSQLLVENLLTFRVSLLLISLFSSCSSCSFRAEGNIEDAFDFCKQCHTQVHPLNLWRSRPSPSKFKKGKRELLSPTLATLLPMGVLSKLPALFQVGGEQVDLRSFFFFFFMSQGVLSLQEELLGWEVWLTRQRSRF